MSALPARPFSTVLLREGYSIDDVDLFLAEVDRALRGRLPDAALASRIQGAQFTAVRLRRGYEMSEVDEHLDRLVLLATHGHPPV